MLPDYSNLKDVIKYCKKFGKLRICAIDIGHRNFALCIEEFEFPKDKSVDLLLEGEIIYLQRTDLGERGKTEMDDRKILIACTNYLDSINDQLTKCDIILIEKQLGFMKTFGKSNPFANKLEHHVYSYLTFTFGEFKYYSTFMAKHKTQVLGAPKKQTKPERKKWCIEKGCEILANRGDADTLLIIEKNKSKADDVCDVFCMIQAFKLLYRLLIN